MVSCRTNTLHSDDDAWGAAGGTVLVAAANGGVTQAKPSGLSGTGSVVAGSRGEQLKTDFGRAGRKCTRYGVERVGLRGAIGAIHEVVDESGTVSVGDEVYIITDSMSIVEKLGSTQASGAEDLEMFGAVKRASGACASSEACGDGAEDGMLRGVDEDGSRGNGFQMRKFRREWFSNGEARQNKMGGRVRSLLSSCLWADLFT